MARPKTTASTSSDGKTPVQRLIATYNGGFPLIMKMASSEDPATFRFLKPVAERLFEIMEMESRARTDERQGHKHSKPIFYNAVVRPITQQKSNSVEDAALIALSFVEGRIGYRKDRDYYYTFKNKFPGFEHEPSSSYDIDDLHNFNDEERVAIRDAAEADKVIEAQLDRDPKKNGEEQITSHFETIYLASIYARMHYAEGVAKANLEPRKQKLDQVLQEASKKPGEGMESLTQYSNTTMGEIDKALRPVLNGLSDESLQKITSLDKAKAKTKAAILKNIASARKSLLEIRTAINTNQAASDKDLHQVHKVLREQVLDALSLVNSLELKLKCLEAPGMCIVMRRAQDPTYKTFERYKSEVLAVLTRFRNTAGAAPIPTVKNFPETFKGEVIKLKEICNKQADTLATTVDSLSKNETLTGEQRCSELYQAVLKAEFTVQTAMLALKKSENGTHQTMLKKGSFTRGDNVAGTSYLSFNGLSSRAMRSAPGVTGAFLASVAATLVKSAVQSDRVNAFALQQSNAAQTLHAALFSGDSATNRDGDHVVAIWEQTSKAEITQRVALNAWCDSKNFKIGSLEVTFPSIILRAIWPQTTFMSELSSLARRAERFADVMKDESGNSFGGIPELKQQELESWTAQQLAQPSVVAVR